ncbi:MAG: phenylalanine--tRNA ligase subunit alpha [Anaerolineae bacterium]|nr:MAG: phenylalanine--tRNA ligase subunit alpha [Anaerolineae bacterium]
MLETIHHVQQTGLEALQSVATEEALQAWKVTYLGRNSEIMGVFKKISTLPKEERGQVGRAANQARQALEAAYEEKAAALKQAALQQALQSERLDVTLPGQKPSYGRLHPTTRTLREIYRIFAGMGFQVFRSGEVETDEYNFQLLNFPPNHPAREMQDSFYVASETDRGDNPILLRTHTSPGQIHAMRHFAAMNPDDPPAVRIILPGMCYRFEEISTRYEIQFTQVEGLAVGKNISFSDLKGTLSAFARAMFGQNVRTRFRASHFPFTEPSAEMDVECFLCGGKGCQVCKHTGWLEILGCGMVHPNVLRNGGYDPEKYTGFAFGMGPERITMLRHHIQDIRYFWGNDLRFLEQF